MAEKVTIHHLLTHTSGMSDYWEELFDSKFWEIKTVQQLYDLTADEALDFEPGERFQYSNSGPIVLGLIIEKLSGMSYYDYIRENIYNPAGMINSGCFEVDHPTENLAIGYTRMDYDGEVSSGGWYNNLFMHAVKGGPAGGGYSTVEDLLAFDKALRGHILLSEPFTDTVITGKVDMGPDIRYAYLFGDEISDGQRIVGHNGGAPGISAVLDMYWDSGYTVAVLANYDGTAGLMASKIRRLLDSRFKNGD
jgi:CubicO group peptidase (beta-lactamase class C family)